MSDRASAYLTIADCPLESAQVVIDLIDNHGLHLEFIEDGQPEDHELGLGLVYMDHEITHGRMAVLAAELQERAPAASWETYDEPAFGYMGTIHRYTPDLGLWKASCEDGGQPNFSSKAVTAMIAASRLNPAVTSDRLGITHENELAQLTAVNKDIILRPAAAAV